MLDFGTVRPGTTLYVPFHTFDSNDPSASVTITGLAVTDIEIYRDGSVTQRASDTGYALLDTDGIDFDGITGVHGFSINLASNATAGFFRGGGQYWVVVSAITVDAATVSFVAATFRIGYPDAVLNNYMATRASQTSFTLGAGPADNDALNGMVCLIHDVASGVQIQVGYVSDYVGATRTVTLAADPGIFTTAANDNVAFFLPANLAAVLGTTQTAGNIIADTEAVLADTETGITERATLLADTEAVLTDSEAVLADTEAAVPVLTDTEAILADTNELQTDWADAGRLDAILDAVLADTEAAVPVLTDTEAILADSEAVLLDTEAVLADTEAAVPVLTDTEAILADTEALGASGLTPLASGTAQAGTASTIQLAAAETFADNELNGNVVKITGGTGAGQARLITAYTGATDTATVAPNWTTNPSSDSVYEVVEGAANLVAVQLTTQTAGDLVADTEAVLADTEAAVPVLTDTEAILADSEAVLADSEAIVADTNELQTDWANGGRLDLIIDAVLADTEAAVPVLTDTEAILADTETGLTERATLLADTEAILTDTEASAASPTLLKNTTIATLSSQTSFTLTDGSTDDNAYNGQVIVVTDQTDPDQKAIGSISAYTGATRTVTLAADPAIFTMAVGDTVDVIAATGSQSAALLTDTEAILADTEAAVPVLTDTEAILADSEAIVADTNELQTDWANGGRLDLIVDAVLADTEAAVPVLTDTEAILADSEAVLADTEAAVPVLTDTEAILADTEAAGVPPTAAAIADQVWNEAQADHTSIGSFGETASEIASILADTEAAGPVLTDTEAILADSEAVLADTEAAVPVLTDTEAILSDSEAALLDTEAVLADTEAAAPVLTDTEAILADTEATSVAAILTTQMTESYAADGVAPTLAQALFMIQQMLGDFAVSGTTLSVKQLDGSTEAATYTLNDGTNPTSITRAT